jgi:uncharacterized protein (UPF0261 family)
MDNDSVSSGRADNLSRSSGAAYVAGTFDTKERELLFLKSRLESAAIRTVTVDLSTAGQSAHADISPREIASHHPDGVDAVFTGDRGSAIAAMAVAFERFLLSRHDIGGVIGAGGSGGTALVTLAMRALPVGLPKVMVSTVASGDVAKYVGPSDLTMMHSVTDVSGINRISERVLSNAANALAGMIAFRREPASDVKPAIGLTMFGVTTPCVQAVARALEDRYDCLVFHATGIGGRSMEALVDSGLLLGALDITTTEVADYLFGGVLACTPDRFGAFIRRKIAYVGSVGAVDMVNFGPIETVPERYRHRNLYVHNPQVTLMRTTPEENREIGRWIAERLNLMEGPVRFLLPSKGVSLIDAPGKPFHDPDADAALFESIETTFRPGPNRRLSRLPCAINDQDFVRALVEAFGEIAGAPQQQSRT